MSPFRNILKLSLGDFVAKTLNFLAFVYLARVLGVTGFGIFEFSFSILAYFLLLVNGGIELWATRHAAKAEAVRPLVEWIIPFRVLLAGISFALLIALLPVFPDYPGLQPVLIVLGLTLFLNALNMRWVFLGLERMGRVGLGLMASQIVFATTIFLFVRGPEHVVWVAAMWLLGDLALTLYFGWLFKAEFGLRGLRFRLGRFEGDLRAALTMGASQGIGLMLYNFDTLLLGILSGPNPVGWYRAAYKPITAALAMPITYFQGLFPTLSRRHQNDRGAFDEILSRSLRLTAIFALPLGVGGTFFAAPIILLLFGPEYQNAIPAMQLLSWAATLVILRGNFRQALNAADYHNLDLRCAAIAVGFNVALNLVLIPNFGILGAASATIASEVIWFTFASYYFWRYVSKVSLLSPLIRPVLAAAAMGAGLLLSGPLFWPLKAILACASYFGILFVLGDREVRSWTRIARTIG